MPTSVLPAGGSPGSSLIAAAKLSHGPSLQSARRQAAGGINDDDRSSDEEGAEQWLRFEDEERLLRTRHYQMLLRHARQRGEASDEITDHYVRTLAPAARIRGDVTDGVQHAKSEFIPHYRAPRGASRMVRILAGAAEKDEQDEGGGTDEQGFLGFPSDETQAQWPETTADERAALRAMQQDPRELLENEWVRETIAAEAEVKHETAGHSVGLVDAEQQGFNATNADAAVQGVGSLAFTAGGGDAAMMSELELREHFLKFKRAREEAAAAAGAGADMLGVCE